MIAVIAFLTKFVQNKTECKVYRVVIIFTCLQTQKGLKMRRYHLFLTAFLAIALSGCSYDVVVIDSDGDGVPNDKDGCPYDKLKTEPGMCGCGYREAHSETGNLICQSLGLVDSDGDTVPDIYDECPKNPTLHAKDEKCGCDTDGKVDIATQARVCQTYVDSDGDGVVDDLDGCPYDSSKTEPGECGCGQIDYRENVEQETLLTCMANIDSDSDTVPDVYDECPYNPFKKVEGKCGCDKPEEASCGTTFDDRCPGNEIKLEPGLCGCNMLEIDQCPRNGVPDCIDVLDSHLMANPPACLDLCPDDDEKIEPGFCGCGVKEIDKDGDGNVDYCLTGNEQCSSVDSDGDGVLDCWDPCPFNNAIQFDDADCDGTPDTEDVCPYNPEITSEDKQYDNDYPCQYNEATQTFTVGTGEDLSLLRVFLEDRLKDQQVLEGEENPDYAPLARMPRKPVSVDSLDESQLTIRLIDNIQIHISEAQVLEYDEWGENPALRPSWLPLPPVFNAKIVGGFIEDGKGKKDTPIRITVTNGQKRVPLAGPLFLTLDYTEVSNLILDYDVEGTIAAGLTAAIMASTLDRLTFSGSITKQQEEPQRMWDYIESLLANIPDNYREYINGEYLIMNVAGFTAAICNVSLIKAAIPCDGEDECTIDLPPVVIKDTVCDHAKLYNNGNLDGSVVMGCIAGEVNAEVEYSNADDLKNTIDVLQSSDSLATIGGLFGKVWGNVTLNHIKNEIDSFTCFGSCGGMIGMIDGSITATNVSNVIHKMKCDVPSYSYYGMPGCGGAFGSINLYGSDNSGVVKINHLENRIDDLKASGMSGGLVGTFAYMGDAVDTPIAVFEHIFSEVSAFKNDELLGDDKSSIGLLFGTLSAYADGMEMSSAFKLSNIFTIGQTPYLLGNNLKESSVLDVNHVYYYGVNQVFGPNPGLIARDGGDIPAFIKFEPGKIADVVSDLNGSATPEIWTSKEIEFGENKEKMSIPVFKDSAIFDAAQE